MNKFIASALFLAPMVCMNVYADNTTVACDALKGAVVELTTVAQNAKDKDLEPLIGELHGVLNKTTPGILAALAPLTPEECGNVIGMLSEAPELGALMQAVQPLSEGKAAATVMPMIANEDAAAAAKTISTPAKLQLIDIIANLTKVAVALGADQMAAEMMSCGENTCGAAE